MAAKNGHTEVPGGGHKFPPLQTETYASQLVWLALTFVALYLLMSRIALPRIGSVLEERKQRVDGDLGDAQRLRDKADAANAAYESTLADARSRAQTLANERRQQQATQGAAVRKELDAKLNTRIAEAERVIAGTRSAAMANVQEIAAEAAMAIVERLGGRVPTGQQIATAVAEALKR